MRAKLLLVGGLALLLGACGGKSSSPAPPPPFNKQLLIGKWKNDSEMLLIAGYEFAEDGTLKMTVRGVERPVPGRYTWSGDRDLELKYEGGEEARKEYRAAAKALTAKVQERLDKGELSDRIGPAILASIREELPAEEKVRVGLANPGRFLVLTSPGGDARRFEKAH